LPKCRPQAFAEPFRGAVHKSIAESFRGALHKSFAESFRGALYKSFVESFGAPSESIVPTALPSSSPSCSKEVDFDMCFALDMSGSVCSPNKNQPELCSSCPDQCKDSAVNDGTCCDEFRSIQDFTIDMVTALDSFDGQKSYSIVQFASSGSLVPSSGDKQSTIDSVNGLDYTGGFTNHAEAIDRCREALSSTSLGSNKYMLVITDAVSTRPSQDPVGSAIASADLAKGDDINIIPVFVMFPGQDSGLDFMSTISSDGNVFNVTDFESLEFLEQDLIEQVSCSADIN
ncbi:hypothetical protein THAOC_27211, partial [Thalassiosira oceanica]